MNSRILSALTLLLVMLVTGVFWGTWFTLTRSLDVFPADNFIRIGKTIISNVAWPMRILMPATLLTLLWLCLIAAKVRPSFYFFAGSFLLMLITLLITVMVEVPIDDQIKTWTVNTIPDNWTALRARWDTFHALRTFTSILSFVALSIGVVFGNKNDALLHRRQKAI
ncbi:MAG TPA: anthrone oxygenase family protein [Cyclobacteriaceae bacterium]|nr:anthrone oxygenase family protein [Cyclobacteriaceae bacterium]